MTALLAIDAPADVEALTDGEALTERVNDLARRHQRGQTGLMGELMDALAPIVWTALGQYTRSGRTLPATLDIQDVKQELWLMVDRLSGRWDPAGGDFGAFVRSSLHWEIWRYVRTQSPRRRARAVCVISVDHDALVERLVATPDEDGRSWDDRLIAADILDGLDPVARKAVALRLLREVSFAEIAVALGLSVWGATAAYYRGLFRLRILMGEEDETRDLGRLVACLHELAGARRRLPGRGVVCRRAAMAESRYNRLMAVLVASGAIVGRAPHRPGRLADDTPDATLERLMGQRRAG